MSNMDNTTVKSAEQILKEHIAPNMSYKDWIEWRDGGYNLPDIFAAIQAYADQFPSKEQGDGWVSVEDRLPEVGEIDNGTEVLTYPHYINCQYGLFLNVRTGNEETGFYSWDGEWSGDAKIHGVTHWRKRLPLPLPPNKS